jgi:hypothetical protein
VTPDKFPRWEWQVISNGEMIASGFEDGRIEAKFGVTTPCFSCSPPAGIHEPLPDYRHRRHAYYRRLDVFPFSMARHFIVDRRSTAR